MKDPGPKESEIQRVILDWLALKGIWAWRVNNIPVPNPNGGFRRFSGIRGHPDIAGVLQGGRALYAEVKRPGGKLSSSQEEFLDRAASLGAVACVVTSVEELEADLKEAGIWYRKSRSAPPKLASHTKHGVPC